MVKLSFFDSVEGAGHPIGNLFDNYFYLNGISNRLGFRRFEVVHDKTHQIREKSAVQSNKALTALKIISYCFLPFSGLMLLGKLIYRNIHTFSMLNENPLNKDQATVIQQQFDELQPNQSPPAKIIQTPIATAKPMVPPGFPNSGNTCWVNAAMQTLFANKYFLDLAQKPLKERISNKVVFDIELNRNKIIAYPETPEEFNHRKQIQQAILNIAKAREGGQSKDIANALKALQNTFIDSKMYQYIEPIGQNGTPGSIFRAVLNVLNIQCPIGVSVSREEDFQACPSNQLVIDPNNPGLSMFNNLAKHKESIPPIIIIEITASTLSLKPDTIFDLSLCVHPDLKGEKHLYRIVGVTIPKTGHHYAHVRQGNEWYCCNDSSVSLIKEPFLNVLVADLILERIYTQTT